MNSEAEYPELDQLFETYFNQDFDLWGNTICDQLINEADRFMQEHPDDLDEALLARYGNDFDPAPWGHTARSFFELVQRLDAARVSTHEGPNPRGSRTA
jgi:hypothetical protein